MTKKEGLGREGTDLLVVTAFAEAPQVFRSETLDALWFNAQSFKCFIG
jgi:hypothetical protein